jgi:hypothetical protein
MCPNQPVAITVTQIISAAMMSVLTTLLLKCMVNPTDMYPSRRPLFPCTTEARQQQATEVSGLNNHSKLAM